MRDFARVILPFGSPDGAICMLTAYFDDSGTHGSSDVVLWGGVFGHQNQWQYLQELWQKKLDSPSPGKSPLTRFHMFDCQSAINEFQGWSRTATDFLVHELGKIIIQSGIYADFCAVSRADWDELITGDLRTALGDAEGYCLRICIFRALKWAQDHTSDPDIAFVFDNRPQRHAETKFIYEAYRHIAEAEQAQTRLASLSFGSSAAILPLQVADLLAWEFFQHACDLKAGRIQFGKFRRTQLKRLRSSLRVNAGFASRRAIEKIAQVDKDPALLKRVAQLMSEPTFPIRSSSR